MGRKKGSKNKPKEVVGPFNGDKLQEEFDEVFGEKGLQNTELILPGNLGNVTMLNGDVRPIEKVFKKKDGSVTLTIGAPKIPKEIPFPDDWDKMGKIARLEWLTAHPRKK